ncbi:MAG: transcription termination/antitermination protein NusA, partial [Acidobacteria bacterium]
GMKGSRVQSIIRELRGEKIDIIEYSDDLVTFAQSALAPAKITRVSVTHQGETPHLDVIVEDEQLSLAIGKRGQNVRLASELIGSRIDIKSESDVKDEVADALARMLQNAMSQIPAAPKQADVLSAPGIGAEVANRLQEAGYGDVEALADAEPETLLALEVEDFDREQAEALVAWAKELREQRMANLDIGPFRAPEAAPAAGTSMADEDFMAALSRAFAESEHQRSSNVAAAAAMLGGDEPAEETEEVPSEEKES